MILNFNAYQDTLNCIASVEKITYPNYRVVIVDNYSQDTSVAMLVNLPGATLLVSPENYGYAPGNNIGIKYALEHGAQYICVLNNDVEVESGFLEPLIFLLEKDQKTGMAGPCICDFQERNRIQAMGAKINLYTGLTQGIHKGKSYQSVQNETREVDYLGGACFVVRANLLSEVGLIPENYFLFFEETEFCLNLQRAGHKLVCVGPSRIYHKRSATIGKFQGLGYYFLNRNRIVFMRRNANRWQQSIFVLYILLEGVGRILLRREPFKLLRIFKEGLHADLHKVDMEKVRLFLS